ncbi:BTAD domain-containing putative transcriptional regulator [Microlunatus elymi]|nr:BTAD domain-containing putative transcriptional regulator [Microlunatus elymi]
MQIALLGSLEITVAGRPIAVTGSRLRSLLVRLAVDAPKPVPSAELVDAVWGEEPPADAANALQSLVSRLRRALGDGDLVRAEPIGYRLQVERDAVDLRRFEQLADQARRLHREGRLDEALAACTDALVLWRGDPLADAGNAEYAVPVATAYRNQQLDLFGTRIDILLGLGRATELITELEQLVRAHPLREGFAAQQLRALAAAGRTSEALAAYERCRNYLAEQFGSDPGPELQELHLALLRGELQPATTPAGAAAGPRTNLRPGLTSFVGREAEMALLAQSLASSRLVTVVGPGGAGKTRTATEAATRWLARTGHPAWLVELAPVGAGENIPGAVLGALGLMDPRLLERNERAVSVDETERLLDQLRQQPCLLVLDNCEHLIDGAAKFAEDVLAQVPNLRVLATSREPLAITGEVLCGLPPLNLPPLDCPLDRAADFAAVRLWLDRATAIDPGFRLGEQTLSPVLEIVRRLDGLPLAIELAAARLRALPVADIARLLSDRFRLLTGGSRTSLPRHRTLRAVVEWSWDLLTEAERLLAMRLAVFPAGVGIDTATAICADDQLPASSISELLITLSDKSLLQRSATSPVRYRMLETIREYGIERLTETGGLLATRDRLADYFLELVQQLEPALRDRRQLEARRTLDLERDNIFAAVRYLLDNQRARDGLLMILAMLWLFQVRDHENELGYWLEQSIAAMEREPGDDQPDSLLDYGRLAAALANATGSPDVKWTQLRSKVADIMPRLESSPEPPFASLNALRLMLPVYLNLAEGSEQLEDGTDGGHPWPAPPLVSGELVTGLVRDAEQSGDPWVRGLVFMIVASIAENAGDLPAMDRYSARAAEEFEVCGDRWGLSSTMNFRAQVLTLRGDIPEAIELLEKALVLSPLMGADGDTLIIHLRLAALAMQTSDLASARRHLDALREAGHSAMEVERRLFADAVEVELRWQEDDHDGALALAAELRAKIADDDHPNRFASHRTAICTGAIAVAECGAARLAGTGTEDGLRHLAQAVADIRSGFRATMITQDIPLISEFSTVLADLAATAGRPERAAYLLGIGAGFIGVDNFQQGRRANVLRVINPLLDDATFREHFESGKRLARPDAMKALEPDGLITELGLQDLRLV